MSWIVNTFEKNFISKDNLDNFKSHNWKRKYKINGFDIDFIFYECSCGACFELDFYPKYRPSKKPKVYLFNEFADLDVHEIENHDKLTMKKALK